MCTTISELEWWLATAQVPSVCLDVVDKIPGRRYVFRIRRALLPSAARFFPLFRGRFIAQGRMATVTGLRLRRYLRARTECNSTAATQWWCAPSRRWPPRMSENMGAKAPARNRSCAVEIRRVNSNCNLMVIPSVPGVSFFDKGTGWAIELRSSCEWEMIFAEDSFHFLFCGVKRRESECATMLRVLCNCVCVAD